MSRGIQMLRQGREAIERELGETYTVAGISVTGIYKDEPYTDPLRGTVRETIINVARSKFVTLPGTGQSVTNGTDFWRIADVRPAANDTIDIVCEGRV